MKSYPKLLALLLCLQIFTSHASTASADESEIPKLRPFHPEIAGDKWEKYEDSGYYTYSAEFDGSTLGIGIFYRRDPDFKQKNENEDSVSLPVHEGNLEWIKRSNWDHRVLWEAIREFDSNKNKGKIFILYLIAADTNESALRTAQGLRNLRILKYAK